MSEFMQGLSRTNYCGEINESMIGQEVTLMGWVSRRRVFSHFSFILLRDRTGIVQVVVNQDENSQEIIEKDKKIRSEYVIAIKGVVCARTEENINPNMKTGKVEVQISELRILSEACTTPFQIEESINVSTELSLKYRYLDLRRPNVLNNIILRHKVAQAVRKFLDQQGFLEVETPMLTKSTPEGARDYLVPSRIHTGEFYALPQSPQIFKQLLMVGGIDKYFQITKCFRDEDLRADRQPEFTQIDIELSFVNEEDIISLNEKLIKHVFKEVKGIDLEIPFERMPYKEAMERFGSDKPDIRFGMELKDITEIVKGSEFQVFEGAINAGGSVRLIVVPNSADMPRKQLDSLVEFSKTYGAKGLAWIGLNQDGTFKTTISKFFNDEKLKEIADYVGAKEGDLILICADKNSIVFDVLGALRNEMAKRLNLTSPEDYKFLWVTEFPLFEYDEEQDRYVSKHHPFTSPIDEDLEKVKSDPENARAKAYDIVLNGYEIGGGSLRIYQNHIQENMFEALGFSKEEANEQFGFLLEAFKYGTPPHGGIAFGLDRIVMLMANAESIRDVIAFPKVKDASCLLTNAPNKVSKAQLDELGLGINETKEEI